MDYTGYKAEAINPGSFVDVPAGSEIRVVPARAGRFELTIVNDSDTVVYLRLGPGAAVNSGIRLNANGGSYTTTGYMGEVYAIHGAAAAKRLLVTEV